MCRTSVPPAGRRWTSATLVRARIIGPHAISHTWANARAVGVRRTLPYSIRCSTASHRVKICVWSSLDQTYPMSPPWSPIPAGFLFLWRVVPQCPAISASRLLCLSAAREKVKAGSEGGFDLPAFRCRWSAFCPLRMQNDEHDKGVPWKAGIFYCAEAIRSASSASSSQCPASGGTVGEIVRYRTRSNV